MTTSGIDEPAPFVPILARLELFRDLPPADVADIITRLGWISLAGGRILLRRGDPGDAMYVLIAGALGVVPGDPEADGSIAPDRIAGVVRPGQTVGEMALISGEARAATVVALRDCELLSIDRTTFEAIAAEHPLLWRNLTRDMVGRLRRMLEGGLADPVEPKTVALIDCAPGGSPAGQRLITALQAEVGALLPRVARIGGEAAETLTVEELSDIEAQHDLVLFTAHGGEPSWRRFILRQADRAFAILPDAADLDGSARLLSALVDETGARVEPVLLWPAEGRPAGAARLCRIGGTGLHHNLATGRAADAARLARHLIGRAVGVVLAGGGARGFAHLGVLRALRARGLPIDLVGGTSIGAVLGACVAMGWDQDEIEARVHETFVRSNPLNDYTLPRIALMGGRKVDRRLRAHFGDEGRLEDLWLPFFSVSADLASAAPHVHRSGVTWRAVRASLSLPGLLPPVVEDGRMLIDGGALNNLPADVMAEIGRGPVIGLDLDEAGGLPTGIVPLLFRAGTLSGEAQLRDARARCTLLFRSPVAEIPITDWSAFRRAIAIGESHAERVLDASDLTQVFRQGRLPAADASWRTLDLMGDAVDPTSLARIRAGGVA